MREQGKLGWFKHDITHRGVTAWALFAILLIFYFILYFPDKIGEGAQVFGASKATVDSARELGNSLNVFEQFMRWLGGALGFTVNGEKIKKLWQDGWQQPYSATYFERTFPFYGCKVRVEPDRGEVSFFDSRDPSIAIPADRIHPVALSEIVHTLRLIDGQE